MNGNWLPLVGIFLTALLTGTTGAQETTGEWVVLLHGLGRSSLSMKRIQWDLQSAGYHVVNVSYPSRRYSIEQLSEEHVASMVATKVPVDAKKVHFVTHSLGGIVLRRYLADHPMRNLGRVVMLAPPNQGSRLADALKRNALGRWILGPAGCELGTTTNDAPQRLGPIKFPLCVIAGDVSLNPLFSHVMKDSNDGKVSVESAKVPGMSEFVLVHSSHTWLMWRAETVRHVLSFLREG